MPEQESKLVVIDPHLADVLEHLRDDSDFMSWLKVQRSEDEIRQIDMKYPNGEPVPDKHKVELYYFFRMILQENEKGIIH
jgi:dTDP-4-dehydrorhamnose 3,5-epimerase-like enzyme